MKVSIHSIMNRSPVIPVLAIADVRQAVPLATALVEGGLLVLEVTLRTPVAVEAIRAIKAALPQAVVGAGTVLDRTQLNDAGAAGADFIVSPGCTPRLLESVAQSGLPFLPGVSTPSEMMTLLEQGVTAMKLFPAEAAGGIAMLKAVAGPLPQISFCPTGGIGPNNARDYLALSNVACVGGSWLAPTDLVTAARWENIRDLARQSATLSAC